MQVRKIQDPVFGDMEVRHGWQKEELVQFWNKKISLRIKAAQYDNKEITDIQRKNYRYVIGNIKSISEKTKSAITAYMATNKETILSNLPNSANFSAENLVVPKALIFFADGLFGILFDCEWDSEHGLAVNLKDFTVGPQDILL